MAKRKKKKKKKRRKLPPITRLKKKADKALSEYIRAKTKGTYGVCPLCKVNDIECCFHFISRRRVILRWEEVNVIGACHSCNFIEQRFPDLSRAWFIVTYGTEVYLSLVEQAKESFTPTREYLEHIITLYERKLACLE